MGKRPEPRKRQAKNSPLQIRGLRLGGPARRAAGCLVRRSAQGAVGQRSRGQAAVPKGEVVTAERVVFNIKGNDYRLVAAIDFEKGIVWIKWIGSHADYV